MKLSLKNFQIHKDSELELKPFTVIVGRSSSGKTATFRALKALLFNNFSKDLVNNGAKSGTVTLEDESLGTLSISRGSSVSYEINGETLNTVGKNSLPQLVDLGFYPLETDRTKYYPQISEQWDTPFLISYTDAEVSKLLSELSQTGRIKAGKSQIAKKSSDMASELKIRITDRESVQLKLAALGDVKSLQESLQELQEMDNKIRAAQDKVKRAEELRDKIRSIKLTPEPELPQDPRNLINLLKLVSKPEIRVPELPSDPRKLIQLRKVLDQYIPGLPEPISLDKELNDLIQLEKLYVKSDRLHNESIRAAKDLEEVDSALGDLYLELQQLGIVCLECGRPTMETSSPIPNTPV